jgi:hypothetical protein
MDLNQLVADITMKKRRVSVRECMIVICFDFLAGLGYVQSDGIRIEIFLQ